MVCSFIGDQIIPDRDYYPLMDKAIDIAERLIREDEKNFFLTGVSGRFSRLGYDVGKVMHCRHPGTDYYKVLQFRSPNFSENSSHIFTLEADRCRFGDVYEWIVDNSDYVISYVTRMQSFPAAYAKMAAEKGKNMINLGRCIFLNGHLQNACT